MSMAALALAVRNRLRSDLTNFYNNSDPDLQALHRAANCRVMPDARPTARCGQEFIAIFGSSHRPRDSYITKAIEETYGITVAITRKIGVIPADHRGELGWVEDENLYNLAWHSVEKRSREVIKIIDKNYQLLRDADSLFDNDWGFTEPLVWSGCDPVPIQVGSDHFSAYHEGISSHEFSLEEEGDKVYGLLMQVYFEGAVRIQPSEVYDLRTS